MIEDKLTRDERIRLEALAQAVSASSFLGLRTTPRADWPDDLISVATGFEKYIRGGSVSK